MGKLKWHLVKWNTHIILCPTVILRYTPRERIICLPEGRFKNDLGGVTTPIPPMQHGGPNREEAEKKRLWRIRKNKGDSPPLATEASLGTIVQHFQKFNWMKQQIVSELLNKSQGLGSPTVHTWRARAAWLSPSPDNCAFQGVFNPRRFLFMQTLKLNLGM